jgi:hypothetical protein
VCVCVLQAILVPDSSSAARWGALDDVVMVRVGTDSDVQRHWRSCMTPVQPALPDKGFGVDQSPVIYSTSSDNGW